MGNVELILFIIAVGVATGVALALLMGPHDKGPL